MGPTSWDIKLQKQTYTTYGELDYGLRMLGVSA